MSTPIEANTTKLEELLQIAEGLPSQSTVELQSKTVTPLNIDQTVTPDSGYDGLSSVTVEGDANLTSENIKDGVSIFGILGSNKGGATVQVETGTVTGVSGSNKTVDCGFKPDAVFFTGENSYSGDIIHAGVLFSESTSAKTFFTGSSNSYIYSYFTVTQASNGFTVSGKRINTSLSTSNESNRSLNYIAIKFTE